MKVKEAMTSECDFIEPTATLQQAAQMMRDLGCGFLPIGNHRSDGKLEGVITDRDIVVRAVAEGCDSRDTQVNQVETSQVFYCYEDNSIDEAAQSMREQQVYRLIVLNNAEEKKLSGIITLGDILRHSEDKIATATAKGIMNKAA